MSSQTDAFAIDLLKLKDLVGAPKNDGDLFPVIVNAPFKYKVEMAFLFLGIIVLLQVNKEAGTIDRVALSQTELAKRTTDVSYVPFNQIKIPLTHTENIIAMAIKTHQPQDTTDWKYLFTPALTPDQARINQANAGIAYSAVYPLKARDGGALIFSYYQYMGDIGESQRDFMDRYTKLVDKALVEKPA